MECNPFAKSHLLVRFVLQIFWERVHINQLVKCNSFGMGCWSGFGGFHGLGWAGLLGYGLFHFVVHATCAVVINFRGDAPFVLLQMAFKLRDLRLALASGSGL